MTLLEELLFNTSMLLQYVSLLEQCLRMHWVLALILTRAAPSQVPPAPPLSCAYHQMLSQMATGQVGLQGLLARAQLGQELAALHGTSRLPVDPQQLLALMEQQQQVLQQPEGWLHTQGATQRPKMGRQGRGAANHGAAASPAAGLGQACVSKAAAKDASAAASAGKLSKLTGLLQASSRHSTASSLPKAAAASSKVAQWAAAGGQWEEASAEEEIAAFVSKERKRQGLLPAALVVQSAWRALGPRLWHGR